MMWWSLTFKQLVAKNEPRRWTLILVCNCGKAYTSITPYVEFLMNSRFKKFLFVVDSVLVLTLHCFAFLRILDHYLFVKCLQFCMRQWPPHCLHLTKLEKLRVNFSSFDSKPRRMRVGDSASFSLDPRALLFFE